MNIAYWDLSSGITPRMILGALVSAGLRVDVLRRTIHALFGSSWNLNLDECKGNRGKSLCAWIDLQEGPSEKTPKQIAAEMAEVELPAVTEKRAHEILQHVTGAAVGTDVVHLAAAEWAETLCALLGYEGLSLQRSYRSHFSVGPDADADALRIVEGHKIQPCPHRRVPLSPLGISSILTLAPAAVDPPVFLLQHVGTGHDSLPPSSALGTLRLFVGTSSSAVKDEMAYQVEATIDDMNPELYPAILSSLRKQGALDTWWTGAVTKDGRPGATVTALVPVEILPVIIEAMLEETTTIGVRFHEVSRRVLPRREYQVETSLGDVRIKESTLPSGNAIWKAELKDCLRLSDQSGISVKEVRAIVNREIENKRKKS